MLFSETSAIINIIIITIVEDMRGRGQTPVAVCMEVQDVLACSMISPRKCANLRIQNPARC